MNLNNDQVCALEWAMKHAQNARDSVTTTKDKVYFEKLRLELLSIKEGFCSACTNGCAHDAVGPGQCSCECHFPR